MKDKKFLVLLIIAAVWLLIFGGLLLDIRITNPRFEELITFILFGWFAYWSISTAVSSNKKTDTSTPAPKADEVKENSQPNNRN